MLHGDPNCAELYRAGRPPEAGEKFVHPALAKVLRGIARQGSRYFYHGEPAQAAEQACRKMGGVLTAADFAAHAGNFCAPLRRPFCDLTLLAWLHSNCVVSIGRGEAQGLIKEALDFAGSWNSYTVSWLAPYCFCKRD